jgi:hypothetical protein
MALEAKQEGFAFWGRRGIMVGTRRNNMQLDEDVFWMIIWMIVILAVAVVFIHCLW